MITPAVLTILLLLLIYNDFKKGFIVFGTFFFFLKYIPGIGGMSMFFICSCVLLFIGIKKHRKNWSPIPKPILHTSLLMATCWLITEFVSGYHNFSGWFNLVACTFIFPWIMWQYLDSPQIIIRFIKALVISFLIIQVYAVFQEIFHVNPIYALLNKNFTKSSGSYRFGVFRINSFMGFSSTYGTFSCCMFFLFWQLRRKSSIFIRGICLPKYSVLSYRLLLGLAIFGVICCATRSCYIMFIVVLVFVIMDKMDTSATKRNIIYCSLALFAFVCYISDLTKIIDDFIYFVDNSADGSSSDMRESQLEICLYWVRNSQWWGLGRNFIFQVLALKDVRIFGAESIWFRLIVDYGYVGCISYSLWILSICYVLWQYNRYYIAIPLALFIGKTTSILIDVDFEYFLWMAIVLIKCHEHLFKKKYTLRRYEKESRYCNNL